QRKKTPLLSSLPLLMHSICSTKSAHASLDCKSPGPFLRLMVPSFVTLNFDFTVGVVPAKTFQLSRSLPLKIDFGPRGLSMMLRTMKLLPARARWLVDG